MQIQTAEFWKQLIERYFDGDTSRDEEALLLRFLASPQGSSEQYDDVRAVMAYCVAAKQHRKPTMFVTKTTISNRMRWRNIAAVFFMVGVGCTLAVYNFRSAFSTNELCIARVNGHVVTDEEAVMELMNQTIQGVAFGMNNHVEVENEVEEQLDEMFNILNE